jgi:hypothetical protein
MTYIHWEQPFYVNPATGQTSYPGPNPLLGVVAPLPTYGNYGGGAYSEGGASDGNWLTKPDGTPLGYLQLLALGSGGEDPVDYLDYLFYRHDVLTSGPAYSASADIDLLNRLILYSSSDPEANLYAGGAELAMIGSLAAHGELDELSPAQLVLGLTDAVHHIAIGLESLPPDELEEALDFFFESAGDGVFVFDFSLTTHSFGEELVELVALNAVNQLLDAGEAEDVPLDTGFPFFGTSDYQLSYNALTGDLDLVAA